MKSCQSQTNFHLFSYKIKIKSTYVVNPVGIWFTHGLTIIIHFGFNFENVGFLQS